MNEISEPGPAGECSNSRQSRAVVLLCLSSVLHLCRPGPAAVCLSARSKEVGAGAQWRLRAAALQLCASWCFVFLSEVGLGYS